MVYLSRPYHFKFVKDCLPQILSGPFLNTLTHIGFELGLTNLQDQKMIYIELWTSFSIFIPKKDFFGKTIYFWIYVVIASLFNRYS